MWNGELVLRRGLAWLVVVVDLFVCLVVRKMCKAPDMFVFLAVEVPGVGWQVVTLNLSG